MLHHVALVRTNVSEEHSAPIIRVTTSHKTAFFIVTAVITSNLTYDTEAGAGYLHLECSTMALTKKNTAARHKKFGKATDHKHVYKFCTRYWLEVNN
jgi:hypothetical protein